MHRPVEASGGRARPRGRDDDDDDNDDDGRAPRRLLALSRRLARARAPPSPEDTDDSCSALSHARPRRRADDDAAAPPTPLSRVPSRGEAARTPSGLPAAAAVGGAAAPLELENPFGDVPGRSALDAMRRCGGAALERAGEGLRFGGLAVRHTLRHKAATAAELSALADESGDGAEGGGGGDVALAAQLGRQREAERGLRSLVVVLAARFVRRETASPAQAFSFEARSLDEGGGVIFLLQTSALLFFREETNERQKARRRHKSQISASAISG